MKNGLLLAVTFASLVIESSSQAAAHNARAISLFQFGGASGYAPEAGVIAGADGMLFGTTTLGGTGSCSGGAGCGTVFSLAPPQARGGSWTYSVLYEFQGGQDGGFPRAPLMLDRAGTLYGYDADGTFGTVFALAPARNGAARTFQILYIFTGNSDGNLDFVYSPVLQHKGSIYGIASGGAAACGQLGCGSVFQLKRRYDGSWKYRNLYSFTGGTDGGVPTWIAGPDAAGSFYISTALGNGAVVQVSPQADGKRWTANVITRFKSGGRVQFPTNLILTANDVLYGIASRGQRGLVFQLTPPQDGGSKWVRTTLAAISDHRYGPASLALDSGGNLIGTIEGDVDFFAGSAFELSPPGTGGNWTYSRLWNFNHGPDRNPINVVTGLGGHLFGVLNGGDSSDGSIFELR